MNKPDICFVSLNGYHLLNSNSASGFIGGAELQQKLIALELVKRGYSISFITLDHGQGSTSYVGSFKIVAAYRANNGLPIFRFIHPRITGLWKALNIADADIYYVRCASHTLAPVALYAKLYRKKVIYCGANDPDFDPPNLKLPIGFRDKPMYFWGLRNCTKVITQNRIQRDLLMSNFSIKGEIIHNGYKVLDYDISPSKNILWVANIRSFKNPDMFLQLAKAVPEGKFQMIGGEKQGERYLGTNLYQYIKKKSSSIPNLDFMGFIPLQEVEHYFDCAGMFVNTSEHEGFPNTFLQAWARGLPVLSFVDPDDLIITNNLGFVANNLSEMIAIVKDYVHCKLDVDHNSIRNYFNNNLTIAKAADRYEHIFSSI